MTALVTLVPRALLRHYDHRLPSLKKRGTKQTIEMGKMIPEMSSKTRNIFSEPKQLTSPDTRC